jgi:HAD superfamily hydrolase (TIGR01509 family)
VPWREDSAEAVPLPSGAATPARRTAIAPSARALPAAPIMSADTLRRRTALLDVDGTLLDSNDAHAHAWVETLGQDGVSIDFARVRQLMGQGGDKVLAELLGLGPDEPRARRLAEARSRYFLDRLLLSLRPTPGARELLERMRDDGIVRVVATSAAGAELQALLHQAGIADLVDVSATSSDAEQSKPAPDIVEAALAKGRIRAEDALLLGDTPYDIAAAAAAGVASVAVRCGGGWDDAALAGAIAIYDSPAALLAAWEASPFAAWRQRPLSRAR